jgi:hypothetical protein
MQIKSSEISSDSVHSCSYYCDRPECIKAQRDEFVKLLAADKPVLYQHKSPIVNAQGELLGYSDWKNGMAGLPDWPQRSLYAQPQPARENVALRKSAEISSTPSVKPDLAKIRITSANGVTGCILRLHDGEGTVVFRVYDAEHNFIDYTLNHSDLKVTINDEDAFFYQSEDPERSSLDHSLATLGLDVLKSEG